MRSKSICQTCVCVTNSAAELKSHLLLHHVHSVFQCDVCDQVLYSDSDVEEHINKHVADKYAPTCNICREKFCNASDLAVHLTLHEQDVKREHCEEVDAHNASVAVDESFLDDGVFDNDFDNLKVDLFAQENKPGCAEGASPTLNIVSGLATTTSTTSALVDDQQSTTLSKKHGKKFSKVKPKQLKKKSNVTEKTFECRVCKRLFAIEKWCKKHEAKHETSDTKSVTSRDTAVLVSNNVELNAISETESKANGETVVSDPSNEADNTDDERDPTYRPENETSDPENETSDPENETDDCGDVKRKRKTAQNTVTDYQCFVCKKYSQSEKSLTLHMIHHREGDTFPCEICDKVFTDRSRLVAHVSHHLKTISCDVCHKKYHTQYQLDKHMLVHLDGVAAYTCDICDKSYCLEATLANHKYAHSKKEKYRCHICGKNNSSTRLLQAHMRRHTNQWLKCSQCDKQFVTEEGLHQHEAAHAGIKPYICDVCGKAYTYEDSLKAHIERTHVLTRDFHCSTCGNAFLTKRDLQQHLRSHSDVRAFPCVTCGKAFKRKGALKEHQITHQVDKPFKCDKCEFAGQTAAVVQRHQYVHSHDKPFHCVQCDARFKTRNTRHQHMNLVHLKKDHRPHVCAVCGKGFKTQFHLKRHELGHTGIQNFACDICGKRFKQKCHMLFHRRKHNSS